MFIFALLSDQVGIDEDEHSTNRKASHETSTLYSKKRLCYHAPQLTLQLALLFEENGSTCIETSVDSTTLIRKIG